MLHRIPKLLISSSTFRSAHRSFAVGIDTAVISALAAASTGVLTFFVKQRQCDRLRGDVNLHQYRINDLETQLATSKSVEENFRATTEELALKTLEATELRAAFEKLDLLLKSETASRLKTEDECSKATERLKALEMELAGVNSKHMAETRQLAECRGRLESAHAAVQLAKEQAEREKDARTSLEKTVETSLKINVERIRDELLSKAREVVGAGVVETLKSSLRQTPILGRFGEIQLDYLLHEYFALGELKLYDVQVTLESKKRLDAVLKLPMDNGVLHIIVDAKTPNIFHGDDTSDTTVAVTQLRSRLSEVLTVLSKADYVGHYRQHLASKSSKNVELMGSNPQVCDFVLMFLPMDYALLAIDEKLLRKCLEAKVIVCTPTLLGLQIEFIKMAWRQKLPSDAVVQVEGDFTALTDSLVTLNKDLERCGSSLRMATTKAEKASTRLKNSVAGVFLKTVKG